ncbi:MAG: succinate dehydrogenase, hydrophobic membrane anchor protein [Siculibacillus sp.]|nr:succinate dehydrogenase, hydrophobic membrane anchor protein [Siculibacillus sp.]
MNMRTPLSKVTGRGSSKFGTEDYWLQRVTAVAMVPLSIYFIFALICVVGEPHDRARAVLGSPWVAIPFGAMVIAGILHMKIGMQVIIEDYTPSDAWKILFVLMNNFFSALVALATLWAVAKLSFGM